MLADKLGSRLKLGNRLAAVRYFNDAENEVLYNLILMTEVIASINVETKNPKLNLKITVGHRSLQRDWLMT